MMTALPPRPSHSPSVQLPWMQALIQADARLASQDDGLDPLAGTARDAVYYVRCGSGPNDAQTGIDFLSAVARARRLVATGAKRIVFLTSGDTPDGQLQRSLLSFSHHARRALSAHQAEFTVIPVDAVPKRVTRTANDVNAR